MSEESETVAEESAAEAPVPAAAVEDSPERRREYRLNKVLGAELGSGEDTFRARIFVINISRTGLKATNQTQVPPGDDQQLRLFLQAKEPPLDIRAKVAWQKELPLSGMFEIGFQFLHMSDEDSARLDKFIKGESTKVETKTLDLTSPWSFGKYQ